MKYILYIIIVFVFACNQKQDKILPSRTALTESVYASVTIQPDSLYHVYGAVGGILDKNLVEEGDLIAQGDPILQIINNTPKLNTENAKLAFNLAKENYNGSTAILGEIEDEIRASTLKFQNDSINYTRQKNLWNQNIGTKIEFDNRKLAFELSSNQLKQLKSRYGRTKKELKNQLNQAKNNYKASLINTKDFTVKSKINGKVYALYKNLGEIVTTQEPLASVGCSDNFIIELLVDEVDIVKLKIGQKTLITLDAYNSKIYEAVISKIYPRKDERSQTFKVEAVFINKPEVLFPGLSGEGNIIIAQKESVITIPKEYLIDENKVYTEEGLIEVITGLQSLELVEILDGLDETTYILKPKL